MNRRTLVLFCLLLVLLTVVAIGTLAVLNTVAPSDTGEAERQTNQVDTTAVLPGQVGSGLHASGPWWDVYFTAPVYPDDRSRHQGGLDAHLLDLINRTRTSLDVAIYDFDLQNVAAAIASAKQRGVHVRMVTDTDTMKNKDEAIQSALKTVRSENITIIEDKRPSIMHDKFVISDGETVATGSWNYTDGDTYRLNNNLLILQSPELARLYGAEFQQMYEDRKFGTSRRMSRASPPLTIQGTNVEVLFSPENRPSSRIVRAINQAQRDVKFLAFSFTDDAIGQAMIARSREGVNVTGVFETSGSNTTFSEFGVLSRAGLEVYVDGNPWVMHHKVIIIDGKTVLVGSYNFSKNANEENDENLLIIEDPGLAAAYLQEYEFVLDRAKKGRPQ
jgi:phosphatidylserine/phosphatidylglycerophosphate/cardiolipin synthase-like enzyme